MLSRARVGSKRIKPPSQDGIARNWLY